MKVNSTPEGEQGPDGLAVADQSGPIGPKPSTPTSAEPFGAHLEAALRQACQAKLSPINWFRTAWQRGGALTGHATITADQGDVEAVVKLPVSPGERLWLTRLQAAGDVAPTVFADGEALGDYDMAWVVMERLAHGPLSSSWGGAQFDLLVDVAGRFYRAAGEFEVAGRPDGRDWRAIHERARQKVKEANLQDAKRWNQALKKAKGPLREWTAVWQDRPTDQWVHGDLHLGNAMTRAAPPDGPALLFDFARTRPGHWVEDGVYFEHLYWSGRDQLNGRRLCRQIAHERKRLGLAVDEDWSRLAKVKRALLAMSAPAQLEHEGHPRHVQAALEVLEAEVR